MDFTTGQHIHFVGIGGVGLSAIARILLERGFTISGSDRTLNALTDALARDGAVIYSDHHPDHIAGADVVILSSAIRANPEVEAAQAAGIPVYKRFDVMQPLMRGQRVIAVAGTAGKTTTTAMIVHLLREIGYDPSYIVGGVMANTGTNAGVGSGEWFVVEADEYDNMFLGLRPQIAVITNIDYDHPDFFKSEAEMLRSFRLFARLLPDDDAVSKLIGCIDSPQVADLLPDFDDLAFSYSIDDDGAGAFRAVNITPMRDGSTQFDFYMTDELIGTFALPLPGKHNVQNALAALAVSAFVAPQVAWQDKAAALATFAGTGRRFEMIGEVNGVTVIDDYAHHPAKIRATLQAARSRYPDSVIWAVWQPHTYSRTQALIQDFATAFDDADQVIVTEIYAAREAPLDGVTGDWTARQIKHKNVNFCATLHDATLVLMQEVRKSAIIVVMSAGDATQIGYDYLSGSRAAR